MGGGFHSFVYHDDAFGSLDNRKKMRLLEIMRDYADEGIQQIVTTIDSDLPVSGDDSFVADGEVVLGSVRWWRVRAVVQDAALATLARRVRNGPRWSNLPP